MKKLIILIITSFAFAACTNQQRQQELDNREKVLASRETAFAAKEADYQSLLQMRDSLLSKKDTLIARKWPEDMEGEWKGKTICLQSDCEDYVVGDQRTDTWEFAADTNSIFTKVMNRDKLVRIYAANVDSTGIRLHFKTDSAATRKVDMSVVLSAAGKNLIKGTQTISVNNNCRARFSVELIRASNP